MSFSLEQIALVMGKQFTESQLDAVNRLLSKQPATPAMLFMDDPGGTLLGPGTAFFIVVRNCQSEEARQDLINYYLKKFRTEKPEEVWDEIILSLPDRKQCFAMSLFHREVCKVVNYKERKEFALAILRRAMPTAEAKRQSTAEYLDI